MNGKDLFDVINEIDDKYIEEAKETSGAAAENVTPNEATPSAPKALPVKPDRSKLKRNILSVTMAIAALGLMTIGLWKAGLFGGKKDLIEPHASEFTITSDIIDPDLTTPMTTIPLTTITTEDVGHISAQSTEIEIILPTGNETNANGDPIVQPDTEAASHVSMDALATLAGTQTGNASPYSFVLSVDITNNGEHPLYFEDIFTICIEDADGNLVPVAAFEYPSVAASEIAPDDLSGRCLAPSESMTFNLLMDDAYYPFEPGIYTLVMNVRYFDGEIEDAATAEILESYTIAREFDLTPSVYRHAEDSES